MDAFVKRLTLFGTLLAVVAVLASCGGDDDDDGGTSISSFCDEVTSTLTGENAGPDALQNAIDKLQQIDPPEDISEDWDNVMDAYDAEDPSDVNLQEVRKSGEKVQTFLRDECDVAGEN